MELRPLGSTGLAVSPIGLGTVKFGRNQQVKYPRGFALPDDRSLRDLLACARELGINLLDTAPAYGSAEERLGRLLDDPAAWVLVTKVGEVFEDGRSRFDFSAVATRASVERSLRRLRRDVLDVVLVHSHGDDLRIAEHEQVFGELARLQQQGLVRAFGLSGKTVAGGLWSVAHCDVVMATLNPAETGERPVFEAAAERHKGALVKKALQSGHADVTAGGGGIEPALRLALNQRGVSSVVLGTLSPAHLRHNVQVAEDVLQSRQGR